jgi:hypothetical protein
MAGPVAGVGIFLFLFGIPPLVGWLGLLFKKKWAWWILVVLNALYTLCEIGNVWLSYLKNGLLYLPSVLVTAVFLLTTIILILDSPNRRQSINFR